MDFPLWILFCCTEFYCHSLENKIKIFSTIFSKEYLIWSIVIRFWWTINHTFSSILSLFSLFVDLNIRTFKNFLKQMLSNRYLLQNSKSHWAGLLCLLQYFVSYCIYIILCFPVLKCFLIKMEKVEPKFEEVSMLTYALWNNT